MATGAEQRAFAVDTSVAVPLVVKDHPDFAAVSAAVGRRRLGLAGHAAFETFSVLSRLPAPARRTPAVLRTLIERNFSATVFLSPDRSGELLAALATHRIAGGSVYDALVGAAAAEHGLTLITRNRRALSTYAALGVDLEVLSV